MLKIFAAIIAVTLSTFAAAQTPNARWLLISANDKNIFFADVLAKARNVNIVELWTVSFPTRLDPEGIRFSKSLNVFDCTKRIWQIRNIVVEYKSGKTDFSTKTLEWSEVPPDTISESLLNYACYGTVPYSEKIPPIPFELAESTSKSMIK